MIVGIVGNYFYQIRNLLLYQIGQLTNYLIIKLLKPFVVDVVLYSKSGIIS